MFRKILAGLLFALLALAAGLALADEVSGTKVALAGKVVSEDNDQPTALSGIACQPLTGGSGKCLVAIDEYVDAQWATFTLEPPTLTFEDPVRLFADNSLKDIPGELPETSCSAGTGDFDENDSEGAAYLSGGGFYLAASHGCGRNKMRFKSSAFIDMRLAQPYDKTSPVARTLRLNPILASEEVLRAGFGKDVQTGQGISIEGLAAHRDKLFFGLRSPLVDGKAPIVEVSAGRLFSTDLIGPVTYRLHLADLGNDTGIRDIAALAGSTPRFLILTGHFSGEGGKFGVALFEPGKSAGEGTVTPVADLIVPGDEKAEGMAIVAENGDMVTVLVLFDGGEGGDPHLYQLTMP